MTKSLLKPVATQARLQHAEENTADYLEIIADLIRERGEARLVDIAARLGVSKGTVNKKLRQLQREGLVRSQPYRSIFLNPEGEAIAFQSKKRHTLVLEFLQAAGVPDYIAERDAEGIEHHVSPQTLTALRKLTQQLIKKRR
ncbi:MAG: manganese-binding transcriptional regulator MntR [Candidatus Sumerlaeaceae bacterium]